jgi:hypothetical protein
VDPVSALVTELLKKAVTSAGEWLHLGEKRRAAFFKEEVERIHVVFTGFRDDHMQTFSEVRAGLRDHATPVSSILEAVQGKVVAQRAAWFLFDRFDELARTTNATPTDLYFDYLSQVRRCLRHAKGEDDVTIVYYGTLLEKLALWLSNDAERNPEDRTKAIASVDALTRDFQKYTTDVEIAYLKLRDESLVV